jgi:hypothetical protein
VDLYTDIAAIVTLYSTGDLYWVALSITFMIIPVLLLLFQIIVNRRLLIIEKFQAMFLVVGHCWNCYQVKQSWDSQWETVDLAHTRVAEIVFKNIPQVFLQSYIFFIRIDLSRSSNVILFFSVLTSVLSGSYTCSKVFGAFDLSTVVTTAELFGNGVNFWKHFAALSARIFALTFLRAAFVYYWPFAIPIVFTFRMILKRYYERYALSPLGWKALLASLFIDSMWRDHPPVLKWAVFISSTENLICIIGGAFLYSGSQSQNFLIAGVSLSFIRICFEYADMAFFSSDRTKKANREAKLNLEKAKTGSKTQLSVDDEEVKVVSH